MVNLLSGRNFETRDYEEGIAEESYRKLHEGVLKFVNKTNYDRYMMILNSTGIIDSSLIRSDNALNFGYALFILLRDNGIDSNKIETIVRKWLVLSVLTGRYSGSPESMFDYDIKLFAPPSGSFGQNTLKAAQSMGYKTIMWTKDTIDWRDQDENVLYQRAINKPKGGDLILMHPTLSTSKILGKVLAFYQKEGYNLTTVYENIL